MNIKVFSLGCLLCISCLQSPIIAMQQQSKIRKAFKIAAGAGAVVAGIYFLRPYVAQFFERDNRVQAERVDLYRSPYTNNYTVIISYNGGRQIMCKVEHKLFGLVCSLNLSQRELEDDARASTRADFNRALIFALFGPAPQLLHTWDYAGGREINVVSSVVKQYVEEYEAAHHA